jgi:hypothetical protein
MYSPTLQPFDLRLEPFLVRLLLRMSDYNIRRPVSSSTSAATYMRLRRVLMTPYILYFHYKSRDMCEINLGSTCTTPAWSALKADCLQAEVSFEGTKKDVTHL